MAATTTTTKLPPLSARGPVKSSSQPVGALANVAQRIASATPVMPKSGGRKEEDYDRCPGCQGEFRKVTLLKNGGTCLRCKNAANKKPTAGKKKGFCSGKCGKEYTEATLKKHQGMCKRCKDIADAESAGKDEVEPNCRVCQQPTNPVTAEKYSGLCHPCVRELCKGYFAEELSKLSASQ